MLIFCSCFTYLFGIHLKFKKKKTEQAPLANCTKHCYERNILALFSEHVFTISYCSAEDILGAKVTGVGGGRVGVAGVGGLLGAVIFGKVMVTGFGLVRLLKRL
jgi:hypothetical protein